MDSKSRLCTSSSALQRTCLLFATHMQSIKSIYSEFQFEQQINEYTRVAALEKDGASHTYKTLIDHFATNCPNYILRASVLKLGMVDHYLIFAVRKLNAKRLLDKQVK